jgi:hypothetical protein
VHLTSYFADRLQSDIFNDPACIILPGEHPFIEHPTCVCYASAQAPSLAHLEWRLSKREIELDVPASPALLKKIRKGAAASEHMLPALFDLLVEQALI